VFAITSKCDLQRRGRPYIYQGSPLACSVTFPDQGSVRV
jgi:hypothetical protein